MSAIMRRAAGDSAVTRTRASGVTRTGASAVTRARASAVTWARAGVTAALVAVGLVGCGVTIPTDPDGTLERVRGGTLRVGVSPSDPWAEVSDDGQFSGREVELLERFAAHLDAEATFTAGGEEELVGMLERGALDVVAGGLTSTTPWVSKAAVTTSYATTVGERGAPTYHVMLVPSGENAFQVELERFLLDQEVPR